MNKIKKIILCLLFLPTLSFATDALSQLRDYQQFSFEIPSPQSPYKEYSSQISELPIYAFSGEGMISSYLKAAIESSSSSLDIAIYGISDPELAQSVIKAKDKGLKVRIIINQSHLFNNKIDPSLQQLIDAKVEIRTLKGAGRYGIMHNKIAIFDSRILFCGSFNWTLKANNSNFENAVFNADSKYLSGYKSYFNWMWSYAKPYSQGPMADYDSSNLKFIPSDSAPSVSLNSSKFPSYAFSPNGGIKDTIIRAIDSAKYEIKIAIFSFYDENIYDALKRALSRGVKVKITADRVQSSQSDIIKKMFKEGFDLKWSGGFNGGVMHNKFMVLDSKMLISGSFNFSDSAEYYNFENIFLTDKSSYVSAFENEFDHIYSQARKPSQEEIDNINSFSSESRLSSF